MHNIKLIRHHFPKQSHRIISILIIIVSLLLIVGLGIAVVNP